MRRLKTGRRPPIYPKTPGHLPCSSLTHPLPLPSRRPSVSFGGFGIYLRAFAGRVRGADHGLGQSGLEDPERASLHILRVQQGQHRGRQLDVGSSGNHVVCSIYGVQDSYPANGNREADECKRQYRLAQIHRRDDYAAAERAIGAREGDGPGTIWGRGGRCLSSVAAGRLCDRLRMVVRAR